MVADPIVALKPTHLFQQLKARRRYPRGSVIKPVVLLFHFVVDDVHWASSRDRRVSCDQMPDRNTKGIDVASMIQFLPRRLFGGHVVRRTIYGRFKRNITFGCALLESRQTKIGDLDKRNL